MKRASREWWRKEVPDCFVPNAKFRGIRLIFERVGHQLELAAASARNEHNVARVFLQIINTHPVGISLMLKNPKTVANSVAKNAQFFRKLADFTGSHRISPE